MVINLPVYNYQSVLSRLQMEYHTKCIRGSRIADGGKSDFPSWLYIQYQFSITDTPGFSLWLNEQFVFDNDMGYQNFIMLYHLYERMK